MSDFFHHIIVDDEKKVLFCFVPKASFTYFILAVWVKIDTAQGTYYIQAAGVGERRRDRRVTVVSLHSTQSLVAFQYQTDLGTFT